VNDFLSSLLVAVLWVPGPVKDNTTNKEMTPTMCTFTLYLQWGLQVSASMLTLLLACTLYATIVARIDLQEKKTIYAWYLAIFWLPTIFIPLFILLELSHTENVGYCSVRTHTVTIIRLFSWFLPFILQVIVSIPVFKVVYSITQSVHSNVANRTGRNIGILWLCARFIGAQCNQIPIWFPSTIWQFMVMNGRVPGRALNTLIAMAWVFPSLNGFIVLAGNKPLRTSLFKWYTYMHSRSYLSQVNNLP